MDGNHKDVSMWIGGGIVAAVGRLMKRINNRIDRAHERIDKLDEEKVEKDVFQEFKESNNKAHQSMTNQLNRIENKIDQKS